MLNDDYCNGDVEKMINRLNMVVTELDSMGKPLGSTKIARRMGDALRGQVWAPLRFHIANTPNIQSEDAESLIRNVASENMTENRNCS